MLWMLSSAWKLTLFHAIQNDVSYIVLKKNNMTVCMRCLFLISELPAVDDHQLAPGGQVVRSTTREEAHCSAVDRQKSLPK